MQAIGIQDPYYLERRRKELRLYLDCFAKQLYRIYSIMPSQGYVIIEDKLEPMAPPREWRERIDTILKMKDEFVRTKFPEFYVD